MRAGWLGAALAAWAATAAQGGWELQWVRELPVRKPAWEFTPRIPRDVGYEPIVAGGLVIVGCEHNGAVLGLDLATGQERWRFYTSGPVRCAPATDGRRVYVGADDGWLYCLDLDGRLVWKVRGGPSDRKLIAHERLISVWPVSVRPIAAGGKVYFVAGYWPTEGIFVRAVDAASGACLWVNGTAQFRPGDRMRLEGETLHVDGHRGAAAFDIRTGEARTYERLKPAPPEPGEEIPGVEGKVTGRWTAAGRLLVATAEGRVYCFAGDKPPPRPLSLPEAAKARPVEAALAEKVLASTGIREGYCLVAGLKDGDLVAGLLGRSGLHVVAIDSDAAKVEAVRRRLDGLRLFDDHRLSVYVGEAETFGLPPYVAGLIVSRAGAPPTDALARSLRPYGGALARCEGEEVKVARREGPPEGAADWTHEMADAGNSLSAGDSCIRAPLGFLWYGGPAADPRYYFNGLVDHQSGDGVSPLPPNAEVVQGRMVLQGPGVLAAIDVYTGRRLWEAPIPRMFVFGGKGGGVGIHSKLYREPWKVPEALKMEVPPSQQCRTSGLNYVSTADGVYVAAGKRLLRYDLAGGQLRSEWSVPVGSGLCWGNLRVAGDRLVATAFDPKDVEDAQPGHDGNGGDWAKDRMRMSHLLVLDRRSGRLLWHRGATWGFLNQGTAVGGGQVYCVDLVVEGVLAKLYDAGRTFPNKPPMIHALDLETGKVVWQHPTDVLVKQLTYSGKRDILVAPCRNLTVWKDGRWTDPSADQRRGKKGGNAAGRMTGFRGADGQVLWQVEEAPYFEPHILVHDVIIDRYGWSYDLRTGKRHERPSPLTGQAETWNIRRGGCNHLVASDHLVTWRTACYDLAGHSGVTALTGLEAGCSPTFIAADGVLSAGNFGTHYKRSRSTALCFYHLPGGEIWTSYDVPRDTPAAPIKRAGFNFGAPGDRLAADGTLWLAVGAKRTANVAVQPADAQFRAAHPVVAGDWISASHVAGASAIKVPTWLYAGKRPPARTGPPRRYTVRLHFADDEASRPGERVFSVSLEGRRVLDDLDIAQAAGGRNKPLVREFKGLEVYGELDVLLTATRGTTLLSGVEIAAE